MKSEVHLRFTEEKENWLVLDDKAQRFIITSMDEKLVNYIVNCVTMKGVWNEFFRTHEHKSDISITLLQQKFYNENMDPLDSMTGCISILENLARQLSL